jgi:hypothetical protein
MVQEVGLRLCLSRTFVAYSKPFVRGLSSERELQSKAQPGSPRAVVILMNVNGGIDIAL